MASHEPASPTPTPKPTPAPTRRSDALEAELAMLEAMLPPKTEGSAQPAPVDPAKDRGGAA